MTQWASANRILVPLGSPNACPNLFASSVGPQGWPAGQWNTVDLSNAGGWQDDPNIPASAVAVEIRGLVFITNASQGLCDIEVTFRVPGTTFVTGNYQIQALSQQGDGERANVAVMVPVVDRKFQFYWWYPAHCGAPGSGVGLNLFVQAVYCNEAAPVDPPVGETAHVSATVGGIEYAGSIPRVTP
jgi:hypothetical protein